MSKTAKKIFQKFITQYFEKRHQLVCAFVLVDVRHEPQKIDLDFMQWLGENAIPFCIVFTKTTQITSLDALSQIIETTQLPTVGIGGITEDNMMTLKGTGIEGISVVSEIMKADDIPSKVRALKGNMLELKGGNRDDN